MNVEYVDHMGSDLSVVNAARVSFGKHKTELGEDDVRLIRFLSRNNHWTPFSHTSVTVRVKAPIFVARQLFKHKVGMTENEVSRRYVDDIPEFFVPDVWRGRPEGGMKQGSSDTVIPIGSIYTHFLDSTLDMYKYLLSMGVAPEQARMVLPQSMYTEWYWTGNLSSFARIYHLRADSHAQKETQEVAKMIDEIMRPLFPVSWEALTSEVPK
jgi:thymidylate synthase (FAD)